MDHITARKILGVSDKASLNEVRTRFRQLAKQCHPDVSPSNDPNRFILVSTAFLVLQGKEAGIQMDPRVTDDISYAVNLKAKIDDYFDTTVNEFLLRTKQLQQRTADYLKDVIFSADDSSELKKVLDKNVANYLTETSAEVSAHVEHINKHIRASDNEFMFNFFRNMYQMRRSYWLLNLYRNPVAVTEFVGLPVIIYLQYYSEVLTSLPSIQALVSLWWFPLAFAAIGGLILLIQYLMLNPRRQFLPPRLSASGLQALISGHSKDVPTTPGEYFIGGSITGGIIGTLFLPGPGTIIGAAIGSLLGFAGKDLQKTKQKIYDDILREYNLGLEQTNEGVRAWAARSKADLRQAAVESFSRNCSRMSAFIARKSLPLNKILDEKRLLPK